MAKLDREQALKIREVYAQQGSGGAGIGTLAARYGVSSSTVHLIVKGEHHLVRGLPRLPARGNAFMRREAEIGGSLVGGEPVLTPKQAKEIAVKRTGPLGAHRARLRVPCPKCGAKANDPCWSTRGAYPTKLKGLHAQRKCEG